MAFNFYIRLVPSLLNALFVIQVMEFSHCKVLTNISCIGTEREALLEFKRDLIDPSRRLQSWINEDCCEWEGVECSEKNGHVLKLNLRNPCDGLECSLGGKIHPALKELKHLKYLDLSYNNFSTQRIPKFLASLQKLEYLNLSSVGFHGHVSNQLNNLSGLQYLDLSNSWWWPSIKIENLRWLSTFLNLKYLDLSYVPLLNSNQWLSSINMLSSLEFLILRGCNLEDVSTSLHVNFSSLRFLDLSHNSIKSSIPSWFQNLSKLEHLDLNFNNLQGIFPTVILENSRWLSFLDVSRNRLEGELLKNMSIFCNLQVLNLHSNKFSGMISDIKDGALTCGQSYMKTIDVSGNNFSGHIPNNIGNFKNLEFLDLSWNSISGPIPASVGQLSSLRKLYLSSNKLSGNVPESIGQLSNLEVIDIRNNQLDGIVSELHFVNLTSLIALYFYSNELVINVNASWVPPFQIQVIFMSNCKVGTRFPSWLRTQRNISVLYMSNVSISDEVPYWLPDILTNIERLDLSSNMLRGDISRILGKKMPLLRLVSLFGNNLSGSIPNSLCMSIELSFLDLSKNQLFGRLPLCWSKSQVNLEWISLGGNRLNGQIPDSLCHLKRLGVLGLHANGLNGVLPKCLLKLDLVYLDLSDNQLTGGVPPFGWHSQSFRIINLERNYLTGDIPLQLCHLANLQYLSLAHNNIFGGIPLCFNNFSQMWANSTFTPHGRFPLGFSVMVNTKGTSLEFTTSLRYFFSIDLSSNALDGQIPKGLTRLARLQNLNLSQNKLIGEIPLDIGNLRDLESLDLSNNKLSGEIPPSISNLDSLSYLDLSFNNLFGPIQSNNHLSTLNDQSVYRGNNGLCGAPLLKNCTGDEHNDMDKQDSHSTSEDESNKGDSVVFWFYTRLVVGFGMAILGFCGMFFKQSWRFSYFRAADKIVETLSIARDMRHYICCETSSSFLQDGRLRKIAIEGSSKQKITGMELPGGKSLPLGGESSSSSRRDYEVFLSFKGLDTRLNITDSLYAAMIRAGICVFKSNKKLHVGEEIGGELLRVISNSKIYIPIFSKNYASNKWCLRELAYMVECRKRDKKVILPIFYGVDACDLKLKTGSYGKALRKHERQSSEDTTKQWEEALKEVAGIKGYNLKDYGQDKLIALVMEEVFSKLMPTQRNWCDSLVGIDHRMEAAMELLGLGTTDVRFVVIHGMGGIGKTTLAKAIFKRISSQFQSCSFLSNIRENDTISLQKKLSYDVLGIQLSKVFDDDEMRDMIKERLGKLKVILVLDDMSKRDQLMKLAGKSNWFGPGSRIIITTRNTRFLALETNNRDEITVLMHHRDFFFYEMKEMQFHHALQLFSKHSFESDSLPCDYMDISHKIVETTGGLPLALEVIGSLLHSKDKKTWKDTLKKLKKVPHQDVQRKLLISYKELEYEQKQIFLDIACHCIGEERIHAYYMWKACEFFPKSGLRDLIHLSLIKVTEDDRLQMHDQLRDLGRGIVQEECYLVPGKRSRLWCPTIALDVVQNNMGTCNIVALKLTRLGDKHNFTSGEFSRLPSLRFLELNGGNFIGDSKNLLSNLTWLSWRHCPSNLHATSLCLKKLAILKLSESNITKDWSGWGASMVNDNLKVIYLASCNYLKRIPHFSKCLKLKKLALKNCTRLEEIDSSINQLGRLKYLEIDGKVPLPWGNIFPAVHMLPKNSIGGLKSLLVLKMENHDGVRKLPPSIEELPGLKCLSLRGCCNLRELSNSIGELRSLLYLDLGNTGVSALPDSIGRLESLLELNVSYTPIAELPCSIGNLRRLQLMILSSSKIRELPKSIGTLENLLRLSANRCDNLEGEIPSEIAGLSRLEILELACTKVSRLPMTINRLFNLKRLDLGDCKGLQLLPSLPTSVERLDLSSPSLQVVPNLSNLNNLDYLAISDCNCSYEFSIIERGQIPHPNLEWLGRLHKLTRLFVDLFDFVMHPIDLSSLSQLRHFEITCADPGSLIRLPSSLVTLSLKDVKIPIEWSMFSNLENLIGLELFKCWFGEIVFDNVLGQLKKLHNLGVRECDALVRISNVSSLKEHQELWVESCPQLIEIEERPSIEDWSSMERPIPNIPKLEKLPLLTIEYCASLQKIPNACRLYVEGCPRLDGFND